MRFGPSLGKRLRDTCGLAVLSLAACGGDSSGDGPIISPPSNNPTLSLSDAFSNLPAFTDPVAVLQAPGDNSRWYVVELGGKVRVVQNTGGTYTVADFATITVTTGGEQGLLGMAFHPGFPTDPRVFLSYTVTDTNTGVVKSRVSSFTTSNSGTVFNANSEVVLLSVDQPEDRNNHKGGNLAFSPTDGYLYWGLGDGGGTGDPDNNAQTLTTLLGKMLRIDVNSGSPYAIPNGNPYPANAVCSPGGSGVQPCPEIFAYGFRNPWRFSFDRQTGVLWVGDVGQGAREEIDRVTAGGNYGWRCREGTQDYNTAGCASGNFAAPEWDYGRDLGQSITGGYVYRGAHTAMQGKYLYGDFVSGRIWALTPATSGQAASSTEMLDTAYMIASFGEDNAGELYAVDYSGGRIYKMSF